MNEIKTFDQLSLKELYSIRYRIFSIYPSIYHIVRNYEHIVFSFKNKNIKKSFFDILSIREEGDKAVFKASEIIIASLYNNFLYDEDDYPLWIINRSKDFFKNAISIETLKEFSKIFFAYDLITRENIFYRKNFLKKIYFKNEKGAELVKKNILFRHDGWWNNYYGKIVDTDALIKFNKLLYNKENRKKIRKNDFGEYIRFYLTYAYRLTEHNKIKEARKLIKKITRFSWFICYKIGLKRIPFMIQKGILKYVLNIFFIDTDFRRYQLNAYMFLYRSTNNIHEKKKYFRKLERLNSLRKFFFYKFIKTIFTRNQLNKVNFIIRPQHMLKMIEYKIDEYQFYNKKKRKKLLVEINFLFIEIVKSFYLNFYSRSSIFLNYSIITEIFFIIFYYLEKIHGIDIREF